jgi:hypothetical protein
MSKSKFSGYDALLLRIKECKNYKFEKPNELCDFLLECFLKYDGSLNWGHDYIEYVFNNLDFDEWCNQLIKNDFIKSCQFLKENEWELKPGKKVVDLINKHLFETDRIATHEWVEKKFSRIEKNIEELHALADKFFSSLKECKL